MAGSANDVVMLQDEDGFLDDAVEYDPSDDPIVEEVCHWRDA